MLRRLMLMRRMRRRGRRRQSRIGPVGSAAFARGTRTGNPTLVAGGLLLWVIGRSRSRRRRGELVHRSRLRPGQGLRIEATSRDLD